MSTTVILPVVYRYIRLSIEPAVTEPLALRKLLENAMSQSFGVSRAATYMDVLWISADGHAAVIRVSDSDAEAVLASVVVLEKPIRLSVTKHSAFLPMLLSNAESWLHQDTSAITSTRNQ
ncbi:hypothetical protein JB92DRAFT_2794258 [Gautieria morchelliformis]|nr:hypothetical protein JB92DRAFT_2794258 [Gautieria morchelliformis]